MLIQFGRSIQGEETFLLMCKTRLNHWFDSEARDTVQQADLMIQMSSDQISQSNLCINTLTDNLKLLVHFCTLIS